MQTTGRCFGLPSGNYLALPFLSCSSYGSMYNSHHCVSEQVKVEKNE